MPSTPAIVAAEAITLTGTMSVYASQAEASQGIPLQWRAFLAAHPGITILYGASPCTGDHKIHYLTGTPEPSATGDRLTLPAGDYAFLRVDDPTHLRETWVWLLHEWLPTSGRRERNSPEYERFTTLSTEGIPTGPIEIWIPLEPPTHG